GREPGIHNLESEYRFRSAPAAMTRVESIRAAPPGTSRLPLHVSNSTWSAAAASRSRGAMRPRFCKNRSPRKTEGVGNAGCPMHPQPRVRMVSEAHERSHHRFSQLTSDTAHLYLWCPNALLPD